MASETDSDPFDALLSLEDKLYKEGYDLGVADGDRAGLIEGRLFGLEKGFEKYAAMGQVHGRATIWAGRIGGLRADRDLERPASDPEDPTVDMEDLSVQDRREGGAATDIARVPNLPRNTRLVTHIRTLYALAEPGSLATNNSEDAVSEFDDRLKRAKGKVKVIEKLTGEFAHDEVVDQASSNERGGLPKAATTEKGDGSIEDISVLGVRH